MAKKLRPNDKIRGYTITEEINNGAMAISYAATGPGGAKVFFKQYKSPSVTVDWYRHYVKYQQDLRRRIDGNRVKDYTYKMVDAFEEKWGANTFFQVFEWVAGGLDMEKVLEKLRERPSSYSWMQRQTFAKVMMAGINQLHQAQIVHCDLKPANLQLLPDPSIRAGYQLKLIDMDFSILADKKAPWHGNSPYVGTPHYFSPEHLGGQVPIPASDVFTCGLILYELLGQGHPYRTEDDDGYARAVRGHSAAAARLAGPMDSAAVVEGLLHRALSTNPTDRPTALQMNLALNGRPIDGPAGGKGGRTGSDTVPPPPPPPPPPPVRPLTLTAPSGGSILLRIRTDIGKEICKKFGDESIFFDTPQFTLDHKDGQWFILPRQEARNQTLLNRQAVITPTQLKSGDVLAVGNTAKGIVKLPLTVSFS